MKPVNLVIGCGHSLIIKGLRSLFAETERIRITCVVPHALKLSDTRFQNRVDVILLCGECFLRLPEDFRFTMLMLRKMLPDGKVIVFNENFSDNQKISLLQHGVKGFLPADVSPEKIIRAVEAVEKGDLWVSRRIINLSVQNMPLAINGFEKQGTCGLTRRETEILSALSLGLRNSEIGDKLYISEKTVKTHLHRIFKKLGVSCRTSAVIKAIEKKII